MPGPTLEHDIVRGSNVGDTSTVAVLLHGRGSDKHDLLGLRPLLPADWSLVTPRAPFPGAPWGYGPGYAWYRYLEEDRAQVDTLEESLVLLDDFLAGLPGAVGFEPRRVLLGGFSHGGTVGLAYAITRPGAVAAAINFSGFLAAWVGSTSPGLPRRLPRSSGATGLATPRFRSPSPSRAAPDYDARARTWWLATTASGTGSRKKKSPPP
ncbi:MAG: hypothetical protein FJ207_02690 [Gemmatimonadetes bacterium]|nr:hypothetical protein [Gemmatimonadota bacterium]